jgi:hypothetical protein
MTTNTIMLRSLDATLNTNGTYSFTLPIPLDGQYQLLEASVPNTPYSFNTNNNTFTYIDTSATRTITIPPGYYQISTLLPVLTTLMNTASGAGYFTISQDPNSLLVTFAGTAAFTMKFSVLGPNSINPGTTFAAIMGFKNVDYPSNGSIQVTGITPPNLTWTLAYYVSLSGSSSDSGSISVGGTICSFIVPITVNENNLSLYFPRYEQIVHLNTSSLVLTIKDDSGTIANLQGGTFYFVIGKRPTKFGG